MWLVLKRVWLSSSHLCVSYYLLYSPPPPQKKRPLLHSPKIRLQKTCTTPPLCTIYLLLIINEKCVITFTCEDLLAKLTI